MGTKGVLGEAESGEGMNGEPVDCGVTVLGKAVNYAGHSEVKKARIIVPGWRIAPV
jgi:hypothetical protein